MQVNEYRLTIAMSREMHEALLELRCKPEYRSMSIGALIRMLVEKGLEEAEKNGCTT